MPAASPAPGKTRLFPVAPLSGAETPALIKLAGYLQRSRSQ